MRISPRSLSLDFSNFRFGILKSIRDSFAID
jgi:hypothetical protein